MTRLYSGNAPSISRKTERKAIAWKRDKYNVYAFHLDVPAGVTSIDADFQYLSSRDDGFEITDRMMDMSWSAMLLYPAGYFTRRKKSS